VETLVERLGFPADTRYLIVNCDDLGMCHSVNEGIFDALRNGLATSASLIVPGPWAKEALQRDDGDDIGVHLTLNAEFDIYRWGPITQAPSLLGGDGGFPSTVDDVWDHADLDEVRRELRAQIERALEWGFDVSHLDSHMGTVQLRAEFFDVYLDLAVEFALPIRLSGPSSEALVGFPFRSLAAAEGVLSPDHLIVPPAGGARSTLERVIDDLRPGVTEIFLHPATDHAELRSLMPTWAERVDDHRVLCADVEMRARVESSGVVLGGWRELRELQRAG